MLNHYWLSFSQTFFPLFFSAFSSLLSRPPILFIFSVAPNFLILPPFSAKPCMYGSWRWKVGYPWCLHSCTLYVIVHHLTVCHPAPGLDWLRRNQTLHLCAVLWHNTFKTRHGCHRVTSYGFSPLSYRWMFSLFTASMTEMQVRLGWGAEALESFICWLCWTLG